MFHRAAFYDCRKITRWITKTNIASGHPNGGRSASIKAKALVLFDLFRDKWENIAPSAVKCLEKNVEKCFAYLKFDETYRVSLRTTNPIERLNKEFKRRTKPMEIAGGEAGLYNILTFI